MSIGPLMYCVDCDGYGPYGQPCPSTCCLGERRFVVHAFVRNEIDKTSALCDLCREPEEHQVHGCIGCNEETGPQPQCPRCGRFARHGR